MIRILLLLLLTGCAWAPRSTSYRADYAYLRSVPKTPRASEDLPYSLTILVNARHLDYTDGASLLRTMVKHPSDGSLSGDVGHAWILLEGGGGTLEGGHTGEWGEGEPKYLDGIMDLIEAGDPNPVRYLRHTLSDGCFQYGNGGHIPTYAARIPLTHEQYTLLRKAILDTDFSPYNLTDCQCVTFIETLAGLLGIQLDTTVKVTLSPTVRIGKQCLPIYTDSEYCEVIFHSPDRLERELMRLVRCGEAEYALGWYLNRICPEGSQLSWDELPFRASRVWLVR